MGEGGTRPGALHRLRRKVAHIDDATRRRHHVAVQPGDLEQLVHHVVELCRLRRQDLQRRTPSVGRLAEISGRKKAQVPGKHAQRASQLMRGDAEELTLCFVGDARSLRRVACLHIRREHKG